ncbi:glutamate synthase large subunit [Dietzia sp. SLG310A2-38A2]|uniref:glutamate synthase large subunit n=1 Tax=Dietzia sp. SLG310A2-38A2 TaxID=1630643 RepID=UPI0015FB5928|nr:glutamate synthase large subunit [Dietzia sp. SLG310A2-38A2]MBB1029784.1 glutamate synthase large subunit [Dietzia sp. SLG310A2-38A2]
MMTTPGPRGLYRPEYEHDSCGVAFVVDMYGRQSRDIVEKAIAALVNLEHRGAVGAEANTGDGTGLMIQVPDRFFREVLREEQNLELPEAGAYATGLCFLPQSRMLAMDAKRLVERIAAEQGVTVIGWREVPVDDSTVGAISRDAQPTIHQIFVKAAGADGALLTELALERKCFVVRKRCEHELGSKGPGKGDLGSETVYFPSLSPRTFVYKGMLTEKQLPDFYLDLQDERVESALGIVHSRFSTNTFPAWPLAHPFRYVAHNGEINTARGNENWMRARESLMSSEHIEDLSAALPICTPGGSDTARFDEALELLTLAGRTLPHAVLMMVPEAWERHETMDPAKRAFYEYHASLMEAWDGPASITFTDGTVIGAVLDRNGLRPSRIWVTDDGLVVMASEVGVLDIPQDKVVTKTRLRPGRMFLVDTAAGRIIDDQEIKEELAAEHPYQQWLDEGMVRLGDLPQVSQEIMSHERVVLRQRVFGYTEEELRILVSPMARVGAEATGSMGTDTPLPVLSQRARMLFDYFAQRFAQVTNPPLDAIREELVTSYGVTLGPEGDLINPGPDSCRQIKLDNPILGNSELATLLAAGESRQGLRAVTVRGLYNVAHGGRGLRIALDRIRREVSEAIEDGAAVIVLSDRESDERNAPIPSLLLTSAVHHHLVREKTRTRVSLVVESGDAREVHHMAVLFGYGANAINPYMAFESIDELVKAGDLTGIDTVEACANYRKAAAKGVLKVMSKMGISTLASYTGAQLFDITGLSQELCDEYFTGSVSPIDGIGLDEIAEDVARRHRFAFLPRPEEAAHRELEIGGEYQWRREGEYHLFNPDTVFKLQHSTRSGRYEIFKEYSRLVDDQSERLATLRGLFELKSTRPPVSIDEVEPVSEIVKRFSTGAMSYGSISAEAHETLAIAMNRLHARSNSGEGGESIARFSPDPNGDWRRSAIKQVASGRFGVTSNYLANCTDIQIKMAQGAKPGEGGQLPPGKVYPWVAEVRGSTPGVGLISPPPHHDIYSIEDLAQLIYDLKNANPEARIHVKLVAEQGVGTVATGVSKTHADVVLISGHDGGTGASPLTSLKHAGGPWELGLAETQQTLLVNGLRDRIVVQVDGQLKTGRDVIVAALLGGEEFGFATAPLVVAGCVMMRVCHLDTCPVGVATQNPVLRERFNGKAEYVVNFMEFVAEEVREYLAELGFRSLDEAIGHSECLDKSRAFAHNKRAAKLDLEPVFAQADSPFMHQDLRCTKQQDHKLEGVLDRTLIEDFRSVLVDPSSGPGTGRYPICNVNRSVGTMLSHEISKAYGAAGLPDGSIDLTFTGSAGNSFGAFLAAGVTQRVFGDANDYVGKGLSGGRIVVRPALDAAPDFVAENNIIAGNVICYGATSGEIYLRGMVGERFCVRNSGVTAVVEGVGDHACEYMTGGQVVVLGSTGRNVAAGMSGGVAYFYDPDGQLPVNLNDELVEIEELLTEDVEFLHRIVERHAAETDSARAREILSGWAQNVNHFAKIMPRDYKRVLLAIEQAEKDGRNVDEAIMEAANG